MHKEENRRLNKVRSQRLFPTFLGTLEGEKVLVILQGGTTGAKSRSMNGSTVFPYTLCQSKSTQISSVSLSPEQKDPWELEPWVDHVDIVESGHHTA